MEAKVDRETCISCGACAKLCPQVFSVDGDEKACVKVKQIEGIYMRDAVAAEKNCPVDAITIIH